MTLTSFSESIPVPRHPFDEGADAARPDMTELVPSESLADVAAEPSVSRLLFEDYVAQREEVRHLPKIEGEQLRGIQESVRSWIEQERPDFIAGQRYDDHGGAYNQADLTKKFYGLTEYLRANHGDVVDERELATTEAFVTSIFAMYEDRAEDGAVSPDADGSFAFVVPIRCSREDKDYGQEVEPAIPALRYVPNELRAQLIVGVPPFVIDTYRPDQDGKRGYLVFTPFFPDMANEIVQNGGGLLDITRAARPHINNAVDFAQARLGVKVVGLGATLPALSNFGKAVNNENVVITNGHGGTAHLVMETAKKAIADGRVESADAPRIGVLGLGAIGASIANLAAEEFDPPTHIFDTNAAKIDRTAENITAAGNQAKPLENQEALVEESDIILSAIVGRVTLADFSRRPDLRGKVIVDDSQPGSFDPREVREHGGEVVWVIARDTTGNARRLMYDYGTMADGEADLFGCEAEAFSLYQYMQDLRAQGVPEDRIDRIVRRVAVREAVTPIKARRIGLLFKRYGIVPAPAQAFGELLDVPASDAGELLEA